METFKMREVRAAGLVVFRCRAQAAAPDTAEWLLLQAVDRQGNTKHGAETVTMCPPQAPALDPAQGPPGAYGGAQDCRTQGDAGGGGAGGGAADRALGHQTGAEVQIQGLSADQCYGVPLQVREEGAAQAGDLLAGEAAEL